MNFTDTEDRLEKGDCQSLEEAIAIILGVVREIVESEKTGKQTAIKQEPKPQATAPEPKTKKNRQKAQPD